MKSFNELTKEELKNLNETQIEAYIDIELANQGVVKQVNISIDYPDYIKPISVEPERDLTIYEVDGYAFTNKEDAEKLSSFVGQLQQISTSYEWSIGSEFIYAYNQKINTPSIQIKKVYSETKYNAIKENLKLIKQERERKDKEVESVNENALNYEAIEKIDYEIRDKVRDSVFFFRQAEKLAYDYDKYFQITEDKEKALETLFTVYNVQDDELKEQIKIEINKPKLNTLSK